MLSWLELRLRRIIIRAILDAETLKAEAVWLQDNYSRLRGEQSTLAKDAYRQLVRDLVGEDGAEFFRRHHPRNPSLWSQ